MRKIGKIVAILAVILVVIVAGGAILAKVLITPERIQATIVPMAQEQLGREVSLEGIEFSIFSGIVLEGVQVKEENGEDDFIRADRALLRYRLWPLLKHAGGRDLCRAGRGGSRRHQCAYSQPEPQGWNPGVCRSRRGRAAHTPI
jgi:hypothetical protein